MTLRVADLFCGAGGTSCGAESTGVARVEFALNHELAAAQGFPNEYVFAGTKADITRQIGNSVSPPVAAAITRAIAGAA